jgi:hypothetical protein
MGSDCRDRYRALATNYSWERVRVFFFSFLVRVSFRAGDHLTFGGPSTSIVTFSIVPVKVNGGS